MPRGRPPGRPSKIDEVVGHDAQGNPITAAEQIVRLVRQGNYIEVAARAAGIAKESYWEWLSVAAAAHGKVHRGESTTAHERRCMEFSHAVFDAEATSEANDVLRLATAGAPGRTLTHTRTKTDNTGNVVEQVTTTEELPADARVIMWRLERRFPTRWGRQVAITGPDGGNLEVDVALSARDALGDLVEAMAARLAPVQVIAALDADSTDTTPTLAATEERPSP